MEDTAACICSCQGEVTTIGGKVLLLLLNHLLVMIELLGGLLHLKIGYSRVKEAAATHPISLLLLVLNDMVS